MGLTDAKLGERDEKFAKGEAPNAVGATARDQAWLYPEGSAECFGWGLH